VTRDEAARLSWDELEALGICECGQELATHPRLKRPAPMTRYSASPWLLVEGRPVAHAGIVPERLRATETADPPVAAAGGQR
jgi:hypothetical protein